MAPPKLYQHLRKLPGKLLPQFTKYLESPYFHQHAETLQLWRGLCQYAPVFEVADEALFQAAFPGRPYDNARLRVLRTYLFDHLEQFLIQQELQLQKGLRHRLLRKAMENYDLELGSKAAWEPLNTSPYAVAEDAHDEFLRREDLYQHAVRTRNRAAQPDKSAIVLPLDVYYLSVRLKFLCAHVNPYVQTTDPVQAPELATILLLAEQLNLLHEPLVGLYAAILKIFSGQDAGNSLDLFRERLGQMGDNFDPIEKINCYAFLLSVFQQKTMAKEAGAAQQLFELYQEMAELEGIFDQKDFSAIHFRNTVMAAAKVRAFDWALDFIARHRSKLEAPARDGILSYCRAFLFFGMQRFKEAKKELLGVEFFDATARMSRQVLLLRIYYEEDDLQGFESVGHALKIYQNRNKDIHAGSKSATRNLIRFATRLFHLKGKTAPQAEVEKILKAIHACDAVANPEWLFEKAAELMGGA